MANSTKGKIASYQRDIWVPEVATPDDPQFNVVLNESISGVIDVGTLRESVERVLARHDAFSLRFDEKNGTPVQWVTEDEPGALTVTLIDFTEEADTRAACAAWRDQSLSQPFELCRAPLVAATLLLEREDLVHLHLKVHHLIADAWALNQISHEIWTEYRRRIGVGSIADAADTTVLPSYLGAVAAEATYRASPTYEADRAYHAAVLDGVTPALFGRRVKAQAESGPRRARHSFTVNAVLIKRIRQGGSSPFAFLAAAVAVYLSRLHRADEIVLGVPFLNRHSEDERRIIGQFANTLPVRVSLDDGETLHDLASQIRKTTQGLREHERLPLGDLLSHLPVRAGQARQLFDVTLSYLHYPRPAALPEAERDTVIQAPVHAQDVLSIMVRAFEDDADLLVDLDYATDVFDADLPIDSVARHLRHLIKEGAEQPTLRAVDIPLANGEEHAAVLALGRGPHVPYASDATVHELIAQQAARVPDRVAVRDSGGGTLTYAQLQAQANQVAHALRERGVGRGARVAVMMERCPQLIVALLGVLVSGAAYVPVDPGYPAERIDYLLHDSGAAHVLTGPGSPPTPEGCTALPVDSLLHGPETAPLTNVSSHDLTYVIYTSGSTGHPKGVMVEHHSVVNRLAWMQRRYAIDAEDIILQKTPISFDVSVWELFWWAIEGAGLTLLPPGAHKDPGAILRAIAEQRVTTVHFVPSMLGPFLDLIESEPTLLKDAASLRQVFCSGEALPPVRVNQFNRVFGGRPDAPKLVNLYGPTEATVDVSYHDLPSDPARPVHQVPIGRPIDNTALYVMDKQGALQPVGIVGELCIGGVGVARGYLNKPELTREKFAPTPFAGGDRLYRTGDLARWLADGTLEYLGRIDQQVKIRGNRVEPGEVHNRLAAVPGIQDALVVDRHTDTRGTHLVAYYVAETDGITAAHLRAELAQSLPEFMIPSAFVPIDRIPLTPNGKADRRTLPAPEDVLSSAAESEPSSPLNEAEEVLLSVWQDVLGVHGIGVHDDYFLIGGDSIQMLRVRAQAEKRGLVFTLADMMQHTTIAGLVPHARWEEAGQPPDVAPFALVSSVDRARMEGSDDAYPLTRLQLGLVYHSRAEEHGAVYHDVFRYSLTLPWDEELFGAAFERLHARHPVLRSVFDLGEASEPLQIVRKPDSATPGLDVADLRGWDREAAEAEILRHIEEQRFHRYDFERGPLHLFRPHILKDNAVELVLSFHHAILDGGSVANLLSELLRDYLHHLGLTVAPVLDGPMPSPAHHVLAERDALHSKESRAFWRAYLAGASLPQLTSFRSHTTPEPDDHITRVVDLTDDLVTALRSFASRHGLPVKSVLFAAHCLMVSLYAGTDDVVTGLVTHGRPEREGADRIAGLFLNTVPVRISTQASDWTEVAREAQHQEKVTYEHRRFPLSEIQTELRTPELNTAFNYIHFRQLTEVLQVPGVCLHSFQTWEETNFQLLVNAITDPVDGSIRLRLDCAGDIFTGEQADLYAQTFTTVLDRMVHCPNEAVAWAFLAPGASPTVPNMHIDEPNVVPPTVVKAFVTQAARTPDATALADGSRSWTYAELDDLSNRVGNALLRAGTQPGDRVGIAMDRSLETVAVIVGVLKAGAAALPLDTTYPAARLTDMLEQARPHRVISGHAYRGLSCLPDQSTLLAEEILGPHPHPAGHNARPLPDPSLTDIAYVLFTSGSTGRPKGVAQTHRTLAHLVAWQNAIPSGLVGGVTAQYAPLSFDVSFQEIFSTLCGGGILWVLSEEQRRDIPALLRLLDEKRVERLCLPYVALQQLAEAADALGRVPRHLKVLLSSGEQLRVSDEVRRLCAAIPGVVLENQYGPTESHVVTAYTMHGDPTDFPTLPPIGTAITGSGVHVLDADLRPVPVGVTGELYLEGNCLADGYLGRPDLTAERFVSSPSAEGAASGPRPGERLYRTGDLGFLLPSGALVCLGRADSQVKIRGFRVEPLETELALAGLCADNDKVGEVAVVARTRDVEGSFLTAFLTGDPAAVDAVALDRRLRAVVPEYLVPSHYEWLSSLPLTPSGKRDDKALRDMPLTHRDRADATAPRDEYEQALATLVGEQLSLPQVGVLDNVFDLGATSLTAMRLVVVIEQRYGINLPLAEFIAAPTVAALAERLRSGSSTAAFDPLVPIRPDGDKRPLFFVHPMGGNVLCYVRLAHHLPPEQPLYALQAAGVTPGAEPLHSVEEIAASYIAAIRTVQPEGPYLIGGWSFGGFVAFEMARQLRATGEEIQRLILLDTTALNPDRRKETDDEAMLGWFFWELMWLQRGGRSPQELLPSHLTTLEAKFDHIAALAAEEGVLPADSNGAVVRRLFHLYEANWRAAFAYRPPMVEQDTLLIHAIEPLPEVLHKMHTAIESMHADSANGWREMTSGTLKVVEVPGDHLTIMEEPYVARMAREVVQWIAHGPVVGGDTTTGHMRLVNGA
ncbi:amino acid adenylation domain-containing protein [Streptomyces sp. NPDC050658]|uniref:amino acid adenylation domain-containing protein n=1 Tax=unclassified Streptomyces TaxID=2593676 RepID=UPI0034141891